MSAFTGAYVNLLIKQYWEKPNARAEIAAQAAGWEKVRDILAEFDDQFDIDQAVGAQLDIIGKVVGLDRYVPFEVSGAYWTPIGAGLPLADTGVPALAMLTATDVAFIDAVLPELQTYRWSGSAWSQVGTGLAIAGVGNPALAALNSTDVAFIDSVNDELRTYRWDGSAWSQVGTGLVIGGVGIPALAALNSTDVAFIDSANDTLRTYRWSGSAWSQVGAGLAIAGAGGSPALAALNSTDVAFVKASVDLLETYRWNGSAWSLVGAGLAIAGTGAPPALTALDATTVAFIDITNDQLRTYRWSGSAWSQVGTGLDISTVGAPALAALNSTDVAFIDSVNDQLRTYRWRGTNPLALTDDEYRFFLKVKIAVNTGSAYMTSDAKTSIQDVINTAFSGGAYVVDNQDMSLDLYIPASYDLNELYLILALGLLPKPQGVRYATIVQATMGETFGFADNPNSRAMANKFDLVNEPGGVFALKVI